MPREGYEQKIEVKFLVMSGSNEYARTMNKDTLIALMIKDIIRGEGCDDEWAVYDKLYKTLTLKPRNEFEEAFGEFHIREYIIARVEFSARKYKKVFDVLYNDYVKNYNENLATVQSGDTKLKFISAENVLKQI